MWVSIFWENVFEPPFEMRAQQTCFVALWVLKKLITLQAYRSMTYQVLLYRGDEKRCIGIRIKNGAQIFSFGRKSHMDEAGLRKVADTVLKKLDDGEARDAVKRWADEQTAPA